MLFIFLTHEQLGRNPKTTLIMFFGTVLRLPINRFKTILDSYISHTDYCGITGTAIAM
jgi:hypothetical protein